MSLAYIIGAYRDKRGSYYVEQNIRAAEKIALMVWRMGAVVYCPHLNTRHFDGAMEDKVWLAGHIEVLRRSDFVVICPKYKSSAGSLAEIEVARAIRIPRFYMPKDREKLIRHILDLKGE